MKGLLLAILPLVVNALFSQVPFIHSHNDYHKAEPLTLALRHRVFSIEADIYLVNGNLLVAHDLVELATAPTLDKLYLDPISNLFSKNNQQISMDLDYRPNLVIDIKRNGPAILKILEEKLNLYPGVFDPGINHHAVKVIVSGDRGDPANWIHLPSYIFFDGRPYENYDTLTLNRVAMISDSYSNYSRIPDSTDTKILELAKRVHTQGKLLRLWGIPDFPLSWQHLKSLGVDIINTDKVEECRESLGK